MRIITACFLLLPQCCVIDGKNQKQFGLFTVTSVRASDSSLSQFSMLSPGKIHHCSCHDAVAVEIARPKTEEAEEHKEEARSVAARDDSEAGES